MGTASAIPLALAVLAVLETLTLFPTASVTLLSLSQVKLDPRMVEQDRLLRLPNDHPAAKLSTRPLGKRDRGPFEGAPSSSAVTAGKGVAAAAGNSGNGGGGPKRAKGGSLAEHNALVASLVGVMERGLAEGLPFG